MGTSSKISVIIPVYNGEKYLEACVESVRKQTYQNIEIIIINDGSTDQTGEVCARLQKMYDNVQTLELHDEGVSAARNAGMEAAEGDFITFVDADDRLQPGMLEILYDCMHSSGSDIAGCRFFIWKDEEEWRQYAKEQAEKDFLPNSRSYLPEEYVRDAILQGNSRCWSKLYRKEAIGAVRFRTDFTIGEDMLFLVDMLPSVKKITETDYPGYAYFMNPDGAINRRFVPAYMHQITCWELARENMMHINAGQDVYVQATVILMMAVMLTAGKLAMLPARERREHKKYIRLCHTKLREAMQVKGAYAGLSVGYRIKTRFFRYFPKLYLWMYHLLKGRQGIGLP